MGFLEFLLIAGLILINGFFVTVEFALVKVRTTQIDQLAGQGSWAAKLTSKALDHLDFYLSASQIGITVASLVLGRAMHDWVEPWVHAGFEGMGLPSTPIVVLGISIAIVPLVALSLVTFLHMALGEQAPKSLAIRAPKALALCHGAAAGYSLLRILSAHLAAQQIESFDPMGARPGQDQHGRSFSH